MNDTKTIEVDAKFLETCANGTLFCCCLKEDWSLYATIILRFPVSGLIKCQKQGGPTINLIPEYALPCFMEDLFRIQQEGVQVKLETYEVY